MRKIREVKIIDLVLYFLVPLFIILLIVAAFVLSVLFLKQVHIAILITALVLLLYFPLKYFAIGSVLMYKAFAPMEMRSQCRFDPSCSTYMIMSIQKYGLIRGVFRGLRRIVRCRPPNGGVDMP